MRRFSAFLRRLSSSTSAAADSSPPFSDDLFPSAPQSSTRHRAYARGDNSFLSLSRALSAAADVPGIHSLLNRMRSLSPRRRFPESLFPPLLRSLPPSDAIQLFDEMLPVFNISPSSFFLNATLSSLLKSTSHFHLALPFFRRAMATYPSTIQPTILTYNLLLKSLSKSPNKIPDALSIFYDEIPRRCIQPDAYTYSTLIYMLCHADRSNDATAVLDLMIRDGITPSAATFNALISAAFRNSDLPRASKLVKYMLLKGCTPTIVTYNTLIHGLFKKGMLESAINLLDRMLRDGIVPNEITYGTIIDGLAKLGQLSAASNVIEMMEKQGVRANKFMYSTLINGYFKSGHVVEAISSWTVMINKEIKPNTVLYTTLLDGLCQNNKLKEAERGFARMITDGCVPNVLTYSCLVRGYFKSGQSERAFAMWQEMIVSGCEPNEVSYSILIHGLCQEGRVKEGMMVWKNMINKGCVPDVVAYTSMIRGLCLDGRVDGGMRLFNDMLAQGNLEADAYTYNALFDGLIKWGSFTRAMDLLNKMLDCGCDPDDVTCNIFLKGLEGNREKGIEFLEGLVVRLCGRGRNETAAAVTVVMLQKHLPPAAGTWKMVIKGLCSRRKVHQMIEKCWKDIVE